MDRDATVVTGKVMPIINQRHGSTDYKMWVDSDTGVLLKIVETNTAGDVTNLIEVTDLKINGDVDSPKFNTTEPANFKEKTRAKTFRK